MPTAPDLKTMISWALAQEGKSSYYNRGRGVTKSSASSCQSFVASCYFEGGQRPYTSQDMAKTAMAAWKITGTENDLQPPIGAAVYMHGSSKGMGHVGLSLGGGTYIDAGGSTVKKRQVTKSVSPTSTYYYLGWGWNGGTQPTGSDFDMSSLGLMNTSSTDSTTASGFTGGQLFTTKNTRADAMVREVGYMSEDAKPLINKSEFRLSAINYTSLMGFLFSGYGSATGGSGVVGEVNVDGITNPNAKRIFELLLQQGFTAAQCVGILANIRQESGFNPAALNSIGASGLCQWYQGRATAMKNFVGPDWRNDIDGQIAYLMKELQSGYKTTVLDPILAIVDNTYEAALQVMEIFLRKFEIPGNYAEEIRRRSKFAEELWSQIVIQPTSSTSASNGYKTKGQVTTQSGQILKSGTAYDVPSSLNQMDVSSGIYTWYYRNWAQRTNQRKVYDAWLQYGKKYNAKVATVDGYYLVALSQSFGTVGDVVTIELNNGNYFNAVLGDAKGKESNSTYYGHVQGGRTNVVEWEMYYPEGKNGAKNNNQLLQSALKQVGISGKVTRIINYGRWVK